MVIQHPEDVLISFIPATIQNNPNDQPFTEDEHLILPSRPEETI